MRKAVLLLLSMLVATNALAVNETVTLLEAKRVRNVMFVRASGTKLQVKVDNGDYLDVKPAYKASDQINVAFENFNPLLFKVETSEEFSDDETAKAISDFLQKLIDTSQAVGLTPPAAPAGDAVPDALEEMPLEVQRTPAGAPCEDYERVHAWIVSLRILMRTPIVTEARVRKWTEDATSAKGVKDVRADMTQASKELDENTKSISQVVDAIAEHFAKTLNDDELQKLVIAKKKNWEGVTKRLKELEPGGCNAIHASTFAALLDIIRDASKVEAKKEDLKDDLNALNKSLKPYADPTKWINTHDFVLLQPKPDPAKVDKITVAITPRTPPDDDISVMLEEGDPVSDSFALRKYSAIIGEVAAAMIYSDISYAEYGTDTNDQGQTIVKRVEDSHFPVEGALMMNLIPAFMGESFVYPALQLGVSSAKEAPGVLAGVALRFTSIRQLSLSVGRMVTWHKTLKSLHEGDVVDGTADIEADLHLQRAPAAWYGGIQYSF